MLMISRNNLDNNNNNNNNSNSNSSNNNNNINNNKNNNNFNRLMFEILRVLFVGPAFVTSSLPLVSQRLRPRVSVGVLGLRAWGLGFRV